MALLSEHCGKMMTYSAIIKGVWGYPDEGSVKKTSGEYGQYPQEIRREAGRGYHITNELGVGYRMNSD